jgi:hypothetical protein
MGSNMCGKARADFASGAASLVCRPNIINWLPLESSAASGACCCSQAQSSARSLKRAVEWEARGHSQASFRYKRGPQRSLANRGSGRVVAASPASGSRRLAVPATSSHHPCDRIARSVCERGSGPCAGSACTQRAACRGHRPWLFFAINDGAPISYLATEGALNRGLDTVGVDHRASIPLFWSNGYKPDLWAGDRNAVPWPHPVSRYDDCW